MSTRTEAVEAALRNFLAATNKTRWFEAARLDAEKALAMPKDCGECLGTGISLVEVDATENDCPTCHGKGTL